MNQIELNIESRPGVGKGTARKLRAQKRVPGIYYGPHVKTPIAVSVDQAELVRLTGKVRSNTLIKVQSSAGSGLEGKLTLIKNIQTDPVSERPIHVDFYEVNESETLKVLIPLALIGKPIGTAEGGIVEQLRRDIEIRSLPKDIPNKIEVDISALNIGESMHVKDIQLPQGVSIVGNVNYTLVTVVPPEKEEVKAAAAPGTPAEPTVISEEKKAAAEDKKTEDKKSPSK